MTRASAKDLAFLHSLFRETNTDYHLAYQKFNVGAVPTREQVAAMTAIALRKKALLTPSV